MNTIGERLLYLRKLNKLTQKQVAEKTGVQRGNLSHYEKNDFLPSKVALISLANFFKTNYDWIVYGKGAIPESIHKKTTCLNSTNNCYCSIGAKVDFSKRLLFTIKYFHETIDGLCLKLNISKITFKEICMGKNVCALDLLKISNYFNVSMDWIFDGKVSNFKSDFKLAQAYLSAMQKNNSFSYYEEQKLLQCTYDEMELLLFFKNLNSKNKKLIMDMLNSVSDQEVTDIKKL
ncbi:helix-turn-helix domain-containing protein [Clostridium felsineum]|uniref:helix-turn-helix domain-containing protein n=1 Tax=Clostridium felsineum TaxID=36839 RepID=UPI00098C140B|nr:helix-turn-helix transcriptional regulator [Clostridium felsineum]URZ14256.1 hypothetical protein CLFE_002410 [Clostridium felsineum DSM 794]